VDRRHARLGERVVEWLARFGWEVLPEVSYSEFGERGSIDLLAWHPRTRTLLVVELKTELTSIEATIRNHDAKARLAATVARRRLGWAPASVSRLLVLPDERTARRRVAQFGHVLSRAYPVRGRTVRRWLQAPDGSISGLMFVSAADGVRDERRIGPTRRVRRADEPNAAVGPSSGDGHGCRTSRGHDAGHGRSRR
jgi:Holliday junction resolvase-like predicted endonuclease